MKLLMQLRSFVADVFRRSEIDNELDEELRSHVAHRADDLLNSGLDKTEAERRARLEFGTHARYKEECREQVGGNFFETLIQDIRYSARVLRKSPGFTVVAILTLALAIGANAVVFGVLNALILRPLNVPSAQTLYEVDWGADKSGWHSYPDYLDLRDRNRSFENLAAYTISQVALDSGNDPSTNWAYQASGNYFDALKLQPLLGRFFHAADEHGPNSAPYLVLSYAFWQSRFQSDRSVIGRVVLLNKHPFTIIGVAQPEFHGTLLFFTPDFYVPMVDQEQVDGDNTLNVRSTRYIIGVIGHLKAGVTPEQATADLGGVSAYLEKNFPKEDGKMNFSLSRPSLVGDFLGRPVRAFVAGLMLLAGLILLAACANLGSLFAARAADRSREVALRLSLGSSRNRIVRTLFTEAGIISLAGGALGLCASFVLLNWLTGWQPFPRFPISMPVSPDVRVVAVAFLLAIVSGVLFGLLPVRQVLRVDPYQVVKAGSSAGNGRRITARDLLLIVQIAICGVLVTASMVAIRGLERSLHSNFGFNPAHAMLAATSGRMAGYIGDNALVMQKRMIAAAGTIPGVTAIGLVDTPPLTMGGTTTLVFAMDNADPRPANALAQVMMLHVSPDYFRAAGTAMLAGRSVTWHDDKGSPIVAVINREFAVKVFGSVDKSLGGYFKRRDGKRIEVIGVVEDGRYLSLTEDQKPAMFLSLAQYPMNDPWLVVRSSGDQQGLAHSIQSTLRNLDPGLPVFIEPWDNALAGALFPSRIATIALGVLGVMGAMLSITGIFGMAAYSVSKRLKELGIRMALGARRKEILEAALGRAFKLLAYGSIAGLALGLLATRVLAYIVYQATPRDPLVLAAVVISMALLGLAATWIPAQRALSLDPLTLLREE
jgi:predicted permease